MKVTGICFARGALGAALALILVCPAQASLVFSFAFDADQTGVSENASDPGNILGAGVYNPTGGNSVTVPTTGGNYYVDVVVSSDNASVTRIGFTGGYYAAISNLLNGANSLQGGVAANTYNAGTGTGLISTDLNNNDYWGTTQGRDGAAPGTALVGTVQDNNGDGRADLGGITVTAPLNFYYGPPSPMPWWAHPTNFNPRFALTGNNPTSALYAGRTGSLGNPNQEVIGYFIVTTPAYVPSNGSGGFVDSLAFNPELGPLGPQLGAWAWSEIAGGVTSKREGFVSATAGDNNVLAGSGITFQGLTVPEPSTIALVGLGSLGLVACRRRFQFRIRIYRGRIAIGAFDLRALRLINC